MKLQRQLQLQQQKAAPDTWPKAKRFMCSDNDDNDTRPADSQNCCMQKAPSICLSLCPPLSLFSPFSICLSVSTCLMQVVNGLATDQAARLTDELKLFIVATTSCLCVASNQRGTTNLKQSLGIMECMNYG